MDQLHPAIKLEKHPVITHPQPVGVVLVGQPLDAGALREHGQFLLHHVADVHLCVGW